MLLAGSIWWKALVTIVAAVAFVWLFEETMPDSRYVRLPLTLLEPGFDPTAPPSPGARLAFSATAYCKGQVTSAGVAPIAGVTASDPALLPLGSVVQLDFRDDKYDGIYTVLDTGPEIKGREIDLYMWSCNEALQFGRRSVRMTVLRLGWNPRATTRGFFERLLAPRSGPAPAPAAPAAPASPAVSDDAADDAAVPAPSTGP
jgi:3D (Asp-Asp-Asp) domain-containing protein